MKQSREVVHLLTLRSLRPMLSNAEIFIALAIALVPGILAFRLSTELYK